VRETIVGHFSAICQTQKKTKTTPSQILDSDIIALKQRHPHDIWIKIDHNPRQAARICPVRLHHEITKAFISDTAHFTLYSTSSPQSRDHTQFSLASSISQKILSKLPVDRDRWLPHLWQHKPLGLPYLYLTIKDDGVRFRPIGSFLPIQHGPILSIASRCLHALLCLSSLRAFSLRNSFALKTDISALDTRARKGGSFLRFCTFDIKNFFTEINHNVLLSRVKFFSPLFAYSISPTISLCRKILQIICPFYLTSHSILIIFTCHLTHCLTLSCSLCSILSLL